MSNKLNDNFKNLSMHQKQEMKYKEQKFGRPIGLIKFTPKPKELHEKREIYLGNIEHFIESGREGIRDSEEGRLFTSDEKGISYKKILELYPWKARAYIASFTVLFENDFNEDGQIKQETVGKLLNADANEKDHENRCAVIFSLKTESNFMTVLKKIGQNTLEFNNPHLKKPSFNDSSQVFYTNNCVCWRDYFMEKNILIENKAVFNKKEKEAMENLDKLENKNNIVEIGFKGGYVHYNENNLPYDEIKLKDKLSQKQNNKESKVEINSFFEKCLEYCFLQKNEKYEKQHEFRVLVIQYSEADCFPESVKLKYPSKNNDWNSKTITFNGVESRPLSAYNEWKSKKICNSEVACLHINDF